MPVIMPGSGSAKLSEKISEILKIGMVEKTVRRFPDGETYIRIEDAGFSGDVVLIVQSLYPRQNERLLELFFTIDCVRENGGRPWLIIPYFAYARQDRAFQESEAFSLKTIGKILKSLGAERLITVDAHFRRTPGEFDFFGIPAFNVSAVDALVVYAGKKTKDGLVVAGPDEGSKGFLKGMDDAVFLKKTKTCPVCKRSALECRCKRKAKEYVIKMEVPEDLENRNVLLLDDIISTGGTIIAAAKALRQKKNRVFVGCTHGLFLNGSLEKIRELAEDVFCTDTIETDVSRVSVADAISSGLRRLLR